MARRGRGRPPYPDVLTPTEWAVLNMWRHGMAMPEIARRRGISRYAVRYHLRNSAGKLGVDTRALRHFPGFSQDSARSSQIGRSSMTTDSSLSLGQLGQVSMLTKSAPAAEKWYRETLGLPHIFTFGDLVFFDCGGTRLFIRAVRDEEWRASSILYFLVAEIDAAYAALSARGVAFIGAPHLIFKDDDTGVEEWMAFFNDPDGNTLAVMSRVSPAEPA
jgi:DNA-binding CsgD family transcriptional regulator/catechol 2,3-dioxygenase-like lactoylglutathione lyase family enzyme